MSKYIIQSALVREVGAEYDAETAAAKGINIDALVSGGFIVEQSATKAKKSDKTDVTPDTDSKD